MKNFRYLLLALALLPAFAAFSQIGYSYDKSGNRVKSKLTISPVPQTHQSSQVVTTEQQAAVGRISVYPNPATNAVYIDRKEATAARVVLYDIQGKVLREESTSADHFLFDLSTYPNALYFLEVISDSKQEKWKIVKQ